MDRLQHLPVGAIFPLILICVAIGIGLGLLFSGRRR